MTQNTIDLAIAALNLSSPSDTASPGNTGICGGKPPFGKSLQEAMQTTDINDWKEGCDPKQFLPPAGQELPLQSAYNVGLEGITEVRALADAISSITRGTNQLTQQANNGLDISGVTSFVAESARGSGVITDAGSLLDQLNKVLVASSPQTSAANELRSASGFDPSNSEEANFDLRQKSDAPSGNPNENIKRQMGSLKGPLSTGPNEPRITISDTVLIAEPTGSKDLASRPLPLEPGLGLSSITQPESKFVNSGNANQVSQYPVTTKSSEVVSSSELATHLRVLKSSGGGEARLQLHPAELGRMTVSLITEGDEARVSFVVENSQAKQAVEVSLPRLRDLMDEAGLSLTDADVSDRHAKENEDQSAERVMEETTANSGSDAEDFDDFAPPTSSQLVDTFA